MCARKLREKENHKNKIWKLQGFAFLECMLFPGTTGLFPLQFLLPGLSPGPSFPQGGPRAITGGDMVADTGDTEASKAADCLTPELSIHPYLVPVCGDFSTSVLPWAGSAVLFCLDFPVVASWFLSP